MNKFLPFLILIFLVGLIAISTYKLSKEQEIATIESREESGIHFVKTNKPLPNFSLPDLFHNKKVFSKKPIVSEKTKENVSNFLKDDKVYGPASGLRNLIRNVGKAVKKTAIMFN